ncbi:MAG: SDR family oxidoreductase [Planctomycetia bacterium]|nr:SDR family oxidoreductase [Planctomycetia bacterium]
MGLFDGKKGMILGVANDFSIAWAISQKLLEQGAELGFTHLPGDKMERRVRKLAEPVGARLITSCDVQKDEDVARVFEEARATYGSLDFVVHSIAFAPIEDLKKPFARCSREGFKTAMDVSVYSLACVARHAAEVMPDGGSIVTLTYFGGERVVAGYNLMGVCKSALDMAVRYLAYDLGPQKVRVNAVSAGPVKTLAASAVGESDKLAGLYEAVSPMGRNITREEVGSAGMFLLSDLSSGVGRAGRFLVRRRPAGTAMAGYWEFPGGKCEPGESAEQATRRECLEETGLAVVALALRRVITHRYPHAWVELYYYDCATTDPDAEPDAASCFRWVSAPELPALTFPESNAPIVSELAREFEPPA